MAQLTAAEFDDLIAKLIDHLGFNRFHERLLKANALVSRKRPPNGQALAAQLYQLSAGLRREHPARYAVEVLWQDMLSKSINDDQSKTIESLIERVNTCLSERLEVIPEKSADLFAALGAYHRALAVLTTDEIAYSELLLRATTDVARFLRERKSELIAMGTKMSSEEQKAEGVEQTRKAENAEPEARSEKYEA